MLEFNATFFVAMFSFIIFMLMMNSILYKPLSKIVEQREGIINGNYSDAHFCAADSFLCGQQGEFTIFLSGAGNLYCPVCYLLF